MSELEDAARAVAGLFDGDGRGGCYLDVTLPESMSPACMAFVPPESAAAVRRLWGLLGMDVDGYKT